MAKLKMTRDLYIPKGATKVEREDIGAVAYAYEIGSKPCAIMFLGKQSKPASNYSYRTVEKRDEAIEDFFAAQQRVMESKAARKEEQKAAKKAAIEKIKVGDIFVSSWGYDQTNVDFYQIVGASGANFQVQKIGQQYLKSEGTYEYVTPAPESKIGEPFTKRVSGCGGFTMSSFEYASAYNNEPKYQTAWGYGH